MQVRRTGSAKYCEVVAQFRAARVPNPTTSRTCGPRKASMCQHGCTSAELAALNRVRHRVRHRSPHSVRQPVSGNAVSGLLDGALSPLDAAPLELPPSVSLLRWPRSPAPGLSTTSTRGWEPGGGWAIAEPCGAAAGACVGEPLSNAAVMGGKGTANSGGCEASAGPSSRLRFCAFPGESGCPCRSLGSGATIDVLVPGIVRCSGNCKRIVQLKRRQHHTRKEVVAGRWATGGRDWCQGRLAGGRESGWVAWVGSVEILCR